MFLQEEMVLCLATDKLVCLPIEEEEVAKEEEEEEVDEEEEVEEKGTEGVEVIEVTNTLVKVQTACGKDGQME